MSSSRLVGCFRKAASLTLTLISTLLLDASFSASRIARAQSRTVPGTVNASVSVHGTSSDGPALGSLAENFSLPDVRGHLVSLSDLRGEQQASAGSLQSQSAPAVVMLNFWAFWCDTWSAELPSLRELAECQSELNFRMAAVSVDGARLPEFLRGTQNAPPPFPVLLDVGGSLSAKYRIRHVPTVILLDRQGRVRYCAYGYPGNQVILNQIRRIVSGSSRD